MRNAFGLLFPGVLFCAVAASQTPKPVFEVASVKHATPWGLGGVESDAGGGPGTSDPGFYRCHNCPIFWVLAAAYNLEVFEYSGPDFVYALRYDFDAKIPPGTTSEAFHSMLQNLLADRFKLAVHREAKEMPAYELTVARSGPKFHEGLAHDDPDAQNAWLGTLQKDRDGFAVLSQSGIVLGLGRATIHANSQPMSWLVRLLTQQLQGPVVDHTGLSANYDFTVSWAYKDSGVPAHDNASEAELIPALVDAVQSQLGLKIEKKKMPVEVLVVNHLEKSPTEN
jgi:uncharacterized protein (TIGR03435 family)